MTVRMKQRRGTAALWTSTNPTLLEGQIGFETDTGKFKFGDGVTAWTSLGYAGGVGSFQPLDSDLTAIAALTTTSYGRAFLALADAAAGRTALALGSAAVVDTGTGASNVPTVTQADARYQPLDSDLTAIAALSTTSFGRAFLALADAAAGRTALGLGNLATATTINEYFCIAIGDETTAITTGTAKVTFRMPFALTVTAVRATLTTASSSGTPTVDINDGGTTILSTKLTIDANELTSTTAATAAVISDTALADDAEITIDIDVAGTGAAGLKVWIFGTRTV